MRERETTTLREQHLSGEDVFAGVAAALMQVEPGDLPGILRVRRVLEAVANAHDADEIVGVAGRAVLLLDGLIVGEQEFEAAFCELGRLFDPLAQRFPTTSPDQGADTGNARPCYSVPAFTEEPFDAEDGLVGDFIAESLAYVEAAEGALLALEENPEDAESINIVFRAFHTIKGTSGFLGFDTVAELAHHTESLLSPVRDGETPFTPACADLSLCAADMMRALIHGVQGEPSEDMVGLTAGYADLIARLSSGNGDGDDPSAALGRAPVAPVPLRTAGRAPRPAGSGENGRGGADSTLRVRTDRLDRLVDLVGELIVAQSLVAQDPAVTAGSHHELARKIGQSGKIVREMQDLSLSLRMVPLKSLFQRVTRLVRDLSRKSDKRVRFATEGEDTELDRHIVDFIADPLVHMVRNAVDHGIESTREREQRGKDEVGTIRLSAYQRGGGVVVELHDDGRGLSRENILSAALAKGLVAAEADLSDEQVYSLIFEPGFSTAEQVTDLSGRGVGMDVVRRNIEALRGRIEICSKPGEGTTFAVHLPLTLAITDGMLVRIGAERYIIPTLHIQMSLRPEPGAISTVAGRGEVLLLQGRVIPIVRLHRVLEINDAIEDPVRGLLVIVGEGARRSALLVDELLGQQQFVAKPLGEGIERVPGIAGSAILGDGHVGLILDSTEMVSSWGQKPGTALERPPG